MSDNARGKNRFNRHLDECCNCVSASAEAQRVRASGVLRAVAVIAGAIDGHLLRGTAIESRDGRHRKRPVREDDGDQHIIEKAA